MKRILLRLAALMLPFVIGACSPQDAPKKRTEDKPAAIVAPEASAGRPLRMAIGGMLTPKEGYFYYRDFISYVERKIGVPIKVVDKVTYQEINDLLESGELDFAFVCSGPYVLGHDKFGLQLLAAPEVNGKTSYHSLIIANSSSPVRSFSEMRGRRFAFTDPLSNTGTTVPTYLLARMHETPQSFFKELVFTLKHDKSIRMVAENSVDGAAVDSLVWEYMNRKNPEITAKTRVIEKSPPYGIPPVVVSKSIAPEARKKLGEIFLSAHLDPQCRDIFKGMLIDRFVTVSDNDYVSVREMLAWTEKNRRK